MRNIFLFWLGAYLHFWEAENFNFQKNSLRKKFQFAKKNSGDMNHDAVAGLCHWFGDKMCAESSIYKKSKFPHFKFYRRLRATETFFFVNSNFSPWEKEAFSKIPIN